MKPVSRRDFLRQSGGAVGSSWLAVNTPILMAAGQAACTAREAVSPFKNLSAEEARELAAIAEQIFPTTDSPGANEVGVIYFMDEALGSFMINAAGFIKKGLAEFLDAGNGKFAELSAKRQREIMQAREQTPFFGAVRFITVVGMFCMPSRGGNKDHLGWRLLGFDHQHAWQPPFGYYDAKEGSENE